MPGRKPIALCVLVLSVAGQPPLLPCAVSASAGLETKLEGLTVGAAVGEYRMQLPVVPSFTPRWLAIWAWIVPKVTVAAAAGRAGATTVASVDATRRVPMRERTAFDRTPLSTPATPLLIARRDRSASDAGRSAW